MADPLKDVLPTDRPMTAGDNDRYVGQDELGNKIYETLAGQRYTVRPATQEERDVRQPLPVQAKKWWDEGANLPSGEQVLDTLKAIPGEVVNSIDRTMKGTGTVGDFLNTAGMVAAPAAPNLVRAAETDVLSALGASPRWKKPVKASNEPIDPEKIKIGSSRLREVFPDDEVHKIEFDEDWGPITVNENGYDYENLGYARNVAVHDLANYKLGRIDATELADQVGQDATPEFMEYIESRMQRLDNDPSFNDYVAVLRDHPNINPWGDEISNTSKAVSYRSPLQEIFADAQFPKDGMKGSAILKEIQDNPDIRTSEFKAMGFNIDPQKRYTKDELLSLIKDYGYEVNSRIRRDFETMQRQRDLQDPEVDYFELTVEANKPYGGKTFRPSKGTHYADSTIAHGRASIREGTDGNYLLVEELQSDLLQHGYVKPATIESSSKLIDTQVAQLRESIPTPLKQIGTSLADNYEKSMKAILKSSGEGEAGDYLKAWIEEAYNNPESYTKPPKTFDPEDPLIDLDLLDLEFEPLAEDTIKPFSPERSFLDEIKAEVSNTYEWALSDTGNKAYAMARAWSKAVNYTIENSSTLKYQMLEHIKPDVHREMTSDVLAPPVTKTEETVTATMDALIGEAANRGVTKIVVPPQSKIVEKRFTPGSQNYEKAMDPKSGFSATYTKALQSYVDKLKKEFGDLITVREVPMNYSGNDVSEVIGSATQAVNDEIVRGFHPKDEIDLKVSFEQGSPPRGGLNWVKITSEKTAKRIGLSKDQYELFYKHVVGNLASSEISSIRDAFSRAMRDLSDLIPKGASPLGIEIDFTGLANEGYDLSKPRFAEGGVVENVDPVSGNAVPTGSLPHEVRDDVDAKLSEGEYVLPADVVRYFGLSKIENLVAQAKKGLAEMDAKGRIGGKSEDDLPFSPEELMAVDDMPQEAPAQAPQGAPQVRMAVGGVVPPAQPNTPSTPQPPLPEWMLQFGEPSTVVETPQAPPIRKPKQVVSNDRSQAERDAMMPTGMAGSVDQWATKDFINYATQRTSGVNRGINAAINTFMPMGKVLTKLRQNYLEENVPKTMEEMLAVGKDLQGNTLSEREVQDLKSAYEQIKAEKLPENTGILGAVGSKLKDAIQGRSTSSVTPRPSSTQTSNGTTYTGVSDKSSDSSMNSGSGPAWSSATRTNTTLSSSPRPQARPAGMAKGGLVKKRNK